MLVKVYSLQYFMTNDQKGTVYFYDLICHFPYYWVQDQVELLFLVWIYHEQHRWGFCDTWNSGWVSNQDNNFDYSMYVVLPCFSKWWVSYSERPLLSPPNTHAYFYRNLSPLPVTEPKITPIPYLDPTSKGVYGPWRDKLEGRLAFPPSGPERMVERVGHPFSPSVPYLEFSTVIGLYFWPQSEK